MAYHTEQMQKDFTPTGIKVVGPYENDRNECYRELYSDIIREVYGVRDVIIGHHLVYQTKETLTDPVTGEYVRTFVEEIPSADALIFDHDAARKIWGNEFKNILGRLAVEPVQSRDELLAKLYYGRNKGEPCPEHGVVSDSGVCWDCI